MKDALVRLKDAAKLSGRVMINRDATIKRFEFTFEIAWKIMQTIVNLNIKEVYGPRNVIREAAKLGLIDNPKKWFLFLESRNESTHIYHDAIAQKVYKSAIEFIPYVESLVEKTKDYKSES